MRTGLVAIWVMCFLFMGISSAAQVYQTQAGTFLASGKYKGAGVMAISNHLFMHLNYDKAEMHLRLMIPSLITENDSVNELLHNLEGRELAFFGKMNIGFIQTKSHPRQKFATQGMLTINGISRALSFNSVLQHFPRGSASCILSGDFVVNLSEFNVSNLLPGEEKVTVKFNQIVLKKPGE